VAVGSASWNTKTVDQVGPRKQQEIYQSVNKSFNAFILLIIINVDRFFNRLKFSHVTRVSYDMYAELLKTFRGYLGRGMSMVMPQADAWHVFSRGRREV
jgi:hypothetical protein